MNPTRSFAALAAPGPFHDVSGVPQRGDCRKAIVGWDRPIYPRGASEGAVEEAKVMPVSHQAGAIHHARCGGARTRDGLRRQNSEVRGLRERFRLHGRRATLFSRQTIQERSEALQELQGETRFGFGRGSLRDANRLFGVRNRDDGSVQAYAGAPRPLQAVLPAEADAAGELTPQRWFRPLPSANR
jgi:hypothetical protein